MDRLNLFPVYGNLTTMTAAAKVSYNTIIKRPINLGQNHDVYIKTLFSWGIWINPRHKAVDPTSKQSCNAEEF